MANFTDPTQQLAEQKEAMGLPADVQGQLNQAMLRQALAQAMLQRGMQMPEGQTIATGAGAPNRYVKPSAFQYLASLANTAAGASGIGKSQSDITGIMQQFQQAQQQETAQNQATALAHNQIPGASPITNPGQLPPNLQGGYFAELSQLDQASRFPENRARAIKEAGVAADLGKAQASEAGQTQRAVFGAAAPRATVGSVVGASNETPLGGAAPLQAPTAPTPGSDIKPIGMGLFYDHIRDKIFKINPTTNQVEPVAEETLQGKQALAYQQARQEGQLEVAKDKGLQQSFDENQNDATMMQHLQDAQKLLGYVHTGWGTNEFVKFSAAAKRLGIDLGQNPAPVEALRGLMTPLIGQTIHAEGVSGRLSSAVKNAFDNNPGNVDRQKPAIDAALQRAIADIQSQFKVHNQLVDQTAGILKGSVADPRTVTRFRLTPENTARTPLPVESIFEPPTYDFTKAAPFPRAATGTVTH
jgi:hypothetical protein